MSVNKVILLGFVGKEPEIRAMTNGNEVATFSLATTESWKDKITGEKKDKTEWHKIVIYNAGLVNIVKNYIKKGTKLYLEGSLHTKKYVGNDGIEKYSTEIVLQNFDAKIEILSKAETFAEKIEKDLLESEDKFIDTLEEENKQDDDIPF